MLYLFHDNGEGGYDALGKFKSQRAVNEFIKSDLKNLRLAIPEPYRWSRRDYLVARRVK